MAVKLICIDLDQTLLTASKTYDVERFKKALFKLEQLNTMVTIVTGNSYEKVEDYFDEEELTKLYFCCENGNAIFKNRERIHSLALEVETVKGIVRYLNNYPEFAPVVSVNGTSYIGESQRASFDVIQKYNPSLKVKKNLNYVPLEDGVNKIAIFSRLSLDKNKRLAAYINDNFARVKGVTSGDGWTDVYHEDGGKGSAVRYLQEKYGIKPEETMAFGDSLNDASMMNNVKYSIAMANADVDLAALATYQIGSNEEQAVISIMEQMIHDFELTFMETYRIK